MIRRSWLSVAIAGLLLVLRSMAFASPPDPTWIAGFWDDDDGDDVILLITGCTPAVAAATGIDAGPLIVVQTATPDRDDGLVPAGPVAGHDCRAPPAS